MPSGKFPQTTFAFSAWLTPYQEQEFLYQALNANGKVIGAIVCKMENSKSPFGVGDPVRRGYIAMLAVDKSERRAKIGTWLTAEFLLVYLQGFI